MQKEMGFRGRQESYALHLVDFTKIYNEDRTDYYYEWNERLTKTRIGDRVTRGYNPKLFRDLNNLDRCPVALFDLYLEKRSHIKLDKFLVGVNQCYMRTARI